MSQIERFSYRNSANKSVGFCEISICHFPNKINVIVSEIPDNPGMSICNAFEDLFVQVCKFYELDPARVQWFEHWPKLSQKDVEEWHQVLFKLENGRAVNPVWKSITLIR
jgi:hypothetical protein